MIKYIIPVVITAFVTMFGGYYTLKAQTEQAKETIVELKEDAKESKEKINEAENVNIAQTVLLEQLTQTIQSLNKELKRGTTE